MKYSYENFETNLRDTVQVARRSGARVIVKYGRYESERLWTVLVPAPRGFGTKRLALLDDPGATRSGSRERPLI
jgi:hypothetical protein